MRAEKKERPLPSEGNVRRHEMDIRRDIKFGKSCVKQIEKRLELSSNREMIARVQRIGLELAKIANSQKIQVTWGDNRLNPYPYVFKVIKGDEVNAFSLAGGYIYIYEGCLKFAESDDEVAGVLAHEIAHVACRHVPVLRKKGGKFDLLTIPWLIFALMTGSEWSHTAAQTSALMGQCLKSGWSIQAEKAADCGGIQILMKSRYNPVGMLTFQERLNKVYPKRDLGIYMTHPPTDERIKATMEQLKKAEVPLRRSCVCTSLCVHLKTRPEGQVDVEFLDRCLYTFVGLDARRRAEEAVQRLNAFLDEVPQLTDVQLVHSREILGHGKPLLAVTEEDAKLSGKTAPQLAEETLQAVKNAVYSLRFRVWTP
jgi:hypothetical protein